MQDWDADDYLKSFLRLGIIEISPNFGQQVSFLPISMLR